MKKTAVFLIICLLLSLCGCGSQNFFDAGGTISNMESTPVIDYTVPEQTPNILVNRRGYPSVGKKEAAVKGKKLPQEFRLINADTKEVAYRGWIDKITYDQEQGIYVGYASFEEYQTEGTYYLECDYVGRSYSFVLEADFYQNLFMELYGEILEDCEKNKATVKDVTALLCAYEWRSGLFEDENKNKIPDVMETLSKWIDKIDYAQIDVAEGAEYAAFLAKFSYLYQNYDRAYATECLQRASAVFTKIQNTMKKDADAFFALTELYRATGLNTYGNQILEYKSYFQNQNSIPEESGYLYGIMTYMLTRQAVDKEFCGLLMDQLLAKGEEIGEVYDELLQPVNARNNGAEEILRTVVELSCANYVLKSYQNDLIIEEFADYLMGRNQQSVSFYPEQGARAEYFIILANLASLTAA
ncbi:MAG: glycoside hydrolase family 9 protein [Lachnoclostridium sp.]|nr:glycoside hydrolase family 9 protein [Lachnospira sp.]MCM1247280.1 glycoside hydrolase family 9 protein [Lachnoclostridium sp.]MCM1534418.1 glycoside hydrolase family 9 protein [Clostridium sp.]